MGRHILHVDANAFYASVEQQRRPELRDKPVAVCGSQEERHGIVLTASYPAKRKGVKTGMAIWQARQHCPELVMRMLEEGHQVGVHTYDHVLLTGVDRRDYDWQVEGTRRILYKMLGERELWLRPPYGILDETVTARADSPVVLWSVDPEDWACQNADAVTHHILSRIRDGDIVLLHDCYASTVDAALRTVDALQERGIQPVTVEQLAALRGKTAQSGAVFLRFP